MLSSPKVGDRLVSTDGKRVAIVRELSLGHAAWLWVRENRTTPRGISPKAGSLILSPLAGWDHLPPLEELEDV